MISIQDLARVAQDEHIGPHWCIGTTPQHWAVLQDDHLAVGDGTAAGSADVGLGDVKGGYVAGWVG